MRPGPNKRSRGRSNGNGPHHNRPRLPHRIQTFDSNGPNVKIRGNAYQVFERYVALAREAALSGDRIAAENLYQHAEHYFRIMNANGEGQGHAPRPTTPADNEMGPELEANEQHGDGMSHEQPRDHDQRQYEPRQQESRHQPESRQPEPHNPERQPELSRHHDAPQPSTPA